MGRGEPGSVGNASPCLEHRSRDRAEGGITMRVTRTTAHVTRWGVLAAITLAVAGCASGTGGSPDEAPRPTATDVATAAPTTPVPSATAVEPAVASIPTACTDIVDPGTYAATMGETPLNDPEFFTGQMGQLEPSPAAEGADPAEIVGAATQLTCGWRDPRADITGLFVDVATVDAVTAASYPAWLADPTVDQERRGAGVVFDCSERLGGTVCQYTTTELQYDTDYAETVLVRGDVVVTVRQSNYPTDDLLGAIVARIWG